MSLPWGLSATKAGTKVAESKVKNLGVQRKSRFQKEKEEREAKKKQNEAEAAKIYEQFVASFGTEDGDSKTFVRGQTYVPKGAVKDAPARDASEGPAGGTYKLKARKEVSEMEKIMAENSGPTNSLPSLPPPKPLPAMKRPAKNRQIDAFLEEIKNKQEGKGTIPEELLPKGSFDDGDPDTTNLYVGNLAPTVTEELLQEVFAKYGEIYSVKIMWPRTEEEKARKRNCGFVSFYRRNDAEDAKIHLHDSELDGYKMVIGWGKAVKRLNNLDTSTIVSETLVDADADLELPPAMKLKQQIKVLQEKKQKEQEDKDAEDKERKDKEEQEKREERERRDREVEKEKEKEKEKERDEERERESKRSRKAKWDATPEASEGTSATPAAATGATAVLTAPPDKGPVEKEPGEHDTKIVIVIPEDPDREYLISRTARYVAKDGAGIEMRIKEKEATNPAFRFLFEYDSVEALFYRWRVYTMLMGDKDYKWRLQPFQMTVDGPFWIPPEIPLAWREDEQEKKKEAERKERGRSRERRDEGGRRRGKSKEHVERDREKEREEREKERERTKFMTGRQLEKERELARGAANKLPVDDCEDFMDLLRGINRSRQKVKEAMGFALDNSQASDEIVDILRESLTTTETAIPTKMARLYLVSDILHNSSASVRNASTYRTYLQHALPFIFEGFGSVLRSPTLGRMTSQHLEENLMAVLQVWENWSIYPPLFLTGLEATLRQRLSDLDPVSDVEESTLEAERESLLRQARNAGLSTNGTLAEVLQRIRYLDKYVKLKASGNLGATRARDVDLSIYGPKGDLGDAGEPGRATAERGLSSPPPPAPLIPTHPSMPPPPSLPTGSEAASTAAGRTGAWSTVGGAAGERGSDDEEEDVDGVPLQEPSGSGKDRGGTGKGPRMSGEEGTKSTLTPLPKSRFDTDSESDDDDAVDGRPLHPSLFAAPSYGQASEESSKEGRRGKGKKRQREDHGSSGEEEERVRIGDVLTRVEGKEGNIENEQEGTRWSAEEEEERRAMLRQLETKLLLLRDDLEAKGIAREEVERKVGKKRREMVRDWEKEALGRRDSGSGEKRRKHKHGKEEKLGR